MAFSKNFLEKIKKHLLNEKQKLEDQLADFIVQTEEGNTTTFPQYGDHSGENASEVATYENDISIKSTLEKDLRDVKATLQRIKDGTYGVCKYCSRPIKQGRLEIRPTSSACIKCKKKLAGEA